MDKVLIISQWYREPERYVDYYKNFFYPLWIKSLRKNADGAPILMVDNGGEIRPPYEDIEIINLPNPAPHGRGSDGHYRNCWNAMKLGIREAINREYDITIFVGQNFLVGVPFIDAVIRDLKDVDILCSRGWTTSNGCHTEVMAFNLHKCSGLLSKKYLFPLENSIVFWCIELGLNVGECAELYHRRHHPNLELDTVAGHYYSPEQLKEFILKHQILSKEELNDWKM